MQLARMQCPACGAPLTVPSGAHATECDYCRTQFAFVGGNSQPTLRPASLPPAPNTLPTKSPIILAGTSNQRGCLLAAIMWFFGGPLLMMALFVPVALLLPSDAEDRVQMPDALAACLSILLFGAPIALTIYAFVYFRQRANGFVGFLTTPLRALMRRLRR
jgi:LSD1 subclass zinc finger protein